MLIHFYIIITVVVSLFYGLYSPWIFQLAGPIVSYEQKLIGKLKMKIPFDLAQHNIAWWWWQFFINFLQTIIGAYLFWKALEMSFVGQFNLQFYLLLFLGMFGWFGRLEKLFFIFYSEFPGILKQFFELLVALTKKITG